MTRLISLSRPTTGSSMPPAASRVRSRENWSSSLVSPPYSRSRVLPPPRKGEGDASPPMAATTSAWSRRGSTPVPESTRTATPSPSRRIPSSRCSVPT